jgi:hypothetical protein
MQAVRTLEKELGREICGVPTSSGLPCKKWPISKEHGCCRLHAPGVNKSGSQPVEVETGPETAEDSSSLFPKQLTRRFIITLLIFGIFLGLVGSGIWLFYATGVENTRLVSESGENVEEINPVHPDFTRLRELHSENKIDNISALLTEISRVAENPDDRAEALYMQYVLYQNVQQYERAMKAAEKFLNRYPSHQRRPEVLFGSIYLNFKFLQNRSQAENYYNTLKEEFPDSKWLEQASEYF